MTRPAGWYEDPEDPDNLRYWDGVVWLDRSIPRTKPGLDRSSIGAPRPPAPAEPAGARPRPGQDHRGHQPAPGMGPPGARPGWTPYGPPVPTTPDGQPLSGWWRRVVALVLDWLIVSVASVPFVWAPYQQVVGELEQWWTDTVTAVEAGSTQAPVLPEAVMGPLALMSLIFFVVYAVYEVAFLTRKGATPGKMAAGISVRLLERPGPPPLRAAALRVAIKEGPTGLAGVALISTLAFLFQVADRLWPLWDRQRQALHDKAVGTVVVIGRQQRR